MHDAKTQLSDLVARAEAGEEIVIARRNKPAVKLVPIDQSVKPIRKPGALKHLGAGLPEDLFLQPLPLDELEAWEGKFSFGDNDGG